MSAVKEDAMTETPPSSADLLFSPSIRITGSITEDTVVSFTEQLATVMSGTQPLVLELTTLGGDADAARRIAVDIRKYKETFGRPAYFVGKTVVYSAGITIMSAFDPKERYLTSDAMLLIHERRMEKELSMSGPIKAVLQIAKEQIALLETAQRLEVAGFEDFIKGSKLPLDELLHRASTNLYMTASEAHTLGLIAKVL